MKNKEIAIIEEEDANAVTDLIQDKPMHKDSRELVPLNANAYRVLKHNHDTAINALEVCMCHILPMKLSDYIKLQLELIKNYK